MSSPPGPRRPPDSLVTRLFAVLALVALLACVVTALLGAVLGARADRADRLAGLRRQAAVAVATAEASGGPARAQLRVVLLGQRRRPARVRALRAALAGRPPGEGTVRLGEQELLYVLRDAVTGPVAVARGAGREPGDARPRLGTLLLSGAIGLLLAALAAVPLARRLARPLRRLEAATGAIARGEPTGTLPADGPRELRELGASVAALDADLRRARAAERRFLASVSHELRTPLTSIRGWTEALADGHAGTSDAVAVLRTEGARLDALVDDLLALGRAGAAGPEVADEELDLAALAREVVARHAPEARERGVSLRAEVAATAPRARGDHGRLVQVASNLVDNAVRVTGAGGHVVVRVGAGRLEVEDDGPGLDDEDRARAFEPLHLHQRLGPERAGRAGLGLALVAELTRAMGGTVAAEPAPDGGTRFVVALRPGAP